MGGTDEERAHEINQAFLNPEIDGLMCIRGGYGSLRILPYIDYKAAQKHPKLLIGYSDITALQLALFTQAGIPSISGPMVGVDWASIAPIYERQFWQLVAGKLSVYWEELQPLKLGEVEGILLGGNLTMLTRLIGTPYLPPLDGVILFLEDVNEPPYRIDAMLAQLKLTGIWDRLGGLVLGHFTGENSPNQTPPEITEVLEEYCKDAPFPVASNLLYGHIPAKWSIPQGVQARLSVSTSKTTLAMLEPVVDSGT